MAEDEIDRGPEVRLLTELAIQLSIRQASVRTWEDLPALTVETATPGAPMWIFVNPSGRFFVWCDATCRHAVGDPAGAATRIVADIRRRDTGLRNRHA